MFKSCCRCNFVKIINSSYLLHGPNIYYSTVEIASENNNISIDKPKPDIKARVRAKKKPTTDVISQKLSDKSKERAVPSSRISRMLNYGGLVAGLGLGALSESVRKQIGLSAANTYSDSSFLSEANIERIVSTLCKVRGAALKFGQMLSIQDNNFIPKEVQQLFDRVRANADFMPQWQTEQLLSSELGNDWKSLFKEFNMMPFAAASIGQVHQAVTLNNIPVAVKIQYPGVAESIDSDIDTLLSILNFSKILPEGLFLEQAADVARKELSWEVDYKREAQSSAKFKELLDGDDDYFIADCFPHLSTKRILTTELLQGVPLDEVAFMDQNTRNRVSIMVLRLCLRELFEFNYMQTDPNWSNFFYNKETDQLCLLDFGASRAYNKSFVDVYIKVIDGAARCDTRVVESLLTKLGFQTGYESKALISANVEAVMALGKPFANDEVFDFSKQDITYKIKELIPTMLRHRLTSPPEESYSLHRKLSGAFLLCTKLNAKINCYNIFRDIYDSYDFK
ncbi:atypical kinase COQ8B, mitochondrial isoform X1 [Hydra vulgaris]|uniref:atypical kinase COQ8B, mitochondrial isoform X1 n=1 Tax=Hydra vulgaris TaxID=6087 RepID=UPI001F5FBA32|nr:atypical kinase COQ8B, mitochondrial [Hydra vulgaris]